MKKLVLVLVLAAGAVGSAFAGKVQLAKDGKALAEIVIAEQADRAARFGAQDLAWHLKEITGAEFRIVTAKSGDKLPIYVGESAGTKAKKAQFGKQEYVVDVRPDAIELVGFDKDDKTGTVALLDKKGNFVRKGWPDVHAMQGSMYAVYEFLEFAVGVKWLTQDAAGTMLPKDANLAVETSTKRGVPCFSYRGGTMDDGCDDTVWPWRNKAKQAEYRALAYPGLDDRQISALRFLFILRHRGCGSLNPVNHSFYHFYDQYLHKTSKHFKEYHPEIFAKGYPEGAEPPQLCYTNPKTKELVVKMIRDYFDNGGFREKGRNIGKLGMIWGEDNFSIEPMDNGSMCQCEACRKLLDLDKDAFGPGKPGDSIMWFTFVRDVAAEILKSHPGKTISTLAYGGHEPTPKGIALPPNVKVYFCPSANRGNPCGKGFRGQMARMHDWHEKYPNTKLGVWFYNTFPYEHYRNAGYQGPHGYFAHEAVRQYRELRELNATDGIFHCGLPGSVCIYMAFELMVNPDREADELLDEYFAQFGAAAKPLRKFYDVVERRWCDPSLRVRGKAGQALGWESICPAPVMAELEKLVDEAAALVKTDVERRRFAYWKFDNWDYMKSGFDSYMKRASAPMPTWESVRVPEADGDVAKVAWDKVAFADLPLYNRGGEEPGLIFGKPFKATRRVANDGKWLYVELVQYRDTKTVVISPNVNCYDTWEFALARQRALPYRYFCSGPDGRIFAFSNGEVNFRMNVRAAESCTDAAFFVRCTGDYTAPDKWVQRYAIPLDRGFDQPVAPGETVYFAPVTVISPKGCGSSPYGIYSAVSYTSVHTFDRAVEVKLAK